METVTGITNLRNLVLQNGDWSRLMRKRRIVSSQRETKEIDFGAGTDGFVALQAGQAVVDFFFIF